MSPRSARLIAVDQLLRSHGSQLLLRGTGRCNHIHLYAMPD